MSNHRPVRPNVAPLIFWFVFDDLCVYARMSMDLLALFRAGPSSCYKSSGHTEGVRFKKALQPSPGCCSCHSRWPSVCWGTLHNAAQCPDQIGLRQDAHQTFVMVDDGQMVMPCRRKQGQQIQGMAVRTGDTNLPCHDIAHALGVKALRIGLGRSQQVSLGDDAHHMLGLIHHR